MEFDIIGIDASIANALRRIMIAEVCFVLSILEIDTILTKPALKFRSLLWQSKKCLFMIIHQ